MIATVTYDEYPDCPTEWTDVRIVSFNRRHTAFAHPEEVGIAGVNEYGEPKVMCIGLRTKLKFGTAFVLSYYEHGACEWSLYPGGVRCRWDSAPVAGILYLDDTHGMRYDKRKAYAEAWLKEYTQWCNGEVYTVECDGEVCAGVYDVEAFVRDTFGPDVEITYAL